MNKKVLIIILVIIIICGYFINQLNIKKKEITNSFVYNLDINIGDDYYKVRAYKNKMCFSKNSFIEVYYIDNYYYVFLSRNYKIDGIGVLSKYGEYVYVENLPLIEFDYFHNYKGYTLNDFEKMYGKKYIAVGSGDFIPIYMTTNGKLVFIDVDRASRYPVTNIVVQDIADKECRK